MAAMEKDQKEFVQEAVLGVAISALSYPLYCTKTLAQLGYEPMTPVPTKTLFGGTKLCYPNMFSYARFMFQQEDFGIFTGLPVKLMSTVLQAAVKGHSKKHMDKLFKVKEDEHNRSWEDFARFVGAESVSLSISVVVSQPLRVILIRQVAYLIGKEEAYSSLFSSIQEIFKSEGFAGFFSGLIPQLLAEVSCLWLTHLFTAICIGQLKALPDDPHRQTYEKASAFGSSIFASQLTYSLQLVATNMALCGSSLSAAPRCTGFMDCYRQLRSLGALKRGQGMFLRYAPVPQESYV